MSFDEDWTLSVFQTDSSQTLIFAQKTTTNRENGLDEEKFVYFWTRYLIFGHKNVTIPQHIVENNFQVTSDSTDESLENNFKRLAWDSIGSSLYTTHGSKTMLCWTRQYTNDKESWNAKTVENQT